MSFILTIGIENTFKTVKHSKETLKHDTIFPTKHKHKHQFFFLQTNEGTLPELFETQSKNINILRMKTFKHALSSQLVGVGQQEYYLCF